MTFCVQHKNRVCSPPAPHPHRAVCWLLSGCARLEGDPASGERCSGAAWGSRRGSDPGQLWSAGQVASPKGESVGESQRAAALLTCLSLSLSFPHVCLGRSMQARLSWNTFPASPSSRRGPSEAWLAKLCLHAGATPPPTFTPSHGPRTWPVTRQERLLQQADTRGAL